ncbi:VIR protein [Plasmodium vivax]|uniref:VIR protein n=1 Tax=Plasmodium vivax TaxID=5855 RepID=A0A1G4E5Y7_PLAVI|nr:VIR protein [Plasmodium vivax]
MDWLFRGPSRFVNNYQRYYSGPCMNSYSKLKSEINQKIDDFYNAKHKNIYNEWRELYNYINAKNASIKHCVDNGYIKSNLNEDEKIKNFKSICNKNRICSINVESNINTNPPLTRTGRVEPCKRGTNCKTETAGKSKLRPELDEQSSKAARLQIPKAQSTSREHAGGEEPNKQSAVLPLQSDVKTLLNSIKSEDHEQESVTNKQSSIFVQGSSSTQALADIGDTPPTELNLQAGDSPSQSSSPGESNAGGTLRVSYSDRSLPQNNLTHDQTLNDNPRHMQTHQDGGVEIQDHNHENVVPELSYRVSTLGTDSASKKLDDKDSVVKDGNRPVYNEVAHTLEPASHLDTRNEDVVIASAEGVSSGDTSFNRETDGDQGVPDAVNDREIKNGQERGSEHLCNGIPCNAENGSGLDTGNGNKSDIFSKFVDAISNKVHIVQASAPMGIVLLLGLLFKVN